MWNEKLRDLRRLEREVMQGLCRRSPKSGDSTIHVSQ